MNPSEIHPSHDMEYNYYGSDDHDDHNCKTCLMSTCFMCRTGEGMDDEELAQKCRGFPWTEGIYDGDKLIGRKSGTGWPKGKREGMNGDYTGGCWTGPRRVGLTIAQWGYAIRDFWIKPSPYTDWMAEPVEWTHFNDLSL